MAKGSPVKSKNPEVKVGDYVRIVKSNFPFIQDLEGKINYIDEDGSFTLLNSGYFYIEPKENRYVILEKEIFPKLITSDGRPVFGKCVYTIKKDSLIDSYLRKKEITLSENKTWKTGKIFFEEAKQQNKVFYLILGNARETFCLYAYAEVTDIVVDKEKNKTYFTIKNIKKFKEEKVLKSVLQKTNNGEYVHPDFIRPYTLCDTISVMRYIKDFTEERKK